MRLNSPRQLVVKSKLFWIVSTLRYASTFSLTQAFSLATFCDNTFCFTCGYWHKYIFFGIFINRSKTEALKYKSQQ